MTNNYIDLKLTNITDTVDLLGYYDISIDTDGDLVKEDGFDTNLVVSMFCEKRAGPDEVIEPTLRRGWWGNTLSDTPNFEIGSKLWLLDQAKLTTGTVSLAAQYTQQALVWLKTDGHIKDVIVTAAASFTSGRPNVEVKVDLIRNDNKIEYKYFTVWNKTG